MYRDTKGPLYDSWVRVFDGKVQFLCQCVNEAGGGLCGTGDCRTALMALSAKQIEPIARGKHTKRPKSLILEGSNVKGKRKHFTHVMLCFIKQM